MTVAAVVCVGCARAVVRDVQGDRSLTLPRPARGVVFDFATGPADVQVLSSPRREDERALWSSKEQPDLLAEAVADSLATRLVEDTRSLGLPALAGLFLPTAVLGQLISNTVTALIAIPIVVAAAVKIRISPRFERWAEITGAERAA